MQPRSISLGYTKHSDGEADQSTTLPQSGKDVEDERKGDAEEVEDSERKEAMTEPT